MRRFVLFVTAILIAACTDIYVDTETTVVADGEYALHRRRCGQKAGFPAAGDEPGSQYHRFQVYRCEAGPDRGGY